MSKKSDQRDKLADDVARFLADGNEVEQVDHTASKWFRELGKKRQHIPLRVQHAKQPNHPWHKDTLQ